MYLNELQVLGFIGRTCEVAYLKNGTAVTKFSVATKVSWKDKEAEEWNEKTQWHNVVCFGESFTRLAPRLVKGAYVLVQGEHVTRNYDKTIEVPHGKKTIQVVIKAMAVELKADTIKIFDRAPQLEEQPVEPPQAEDDAA